MRSSRDDGTMPGSGTDELRGATKGAQTGGTPPIRRRGQPFLAFHSG